MDQAPAGAAEQPLSPVRTSVVHSHDSDRREDVRDLFAALEACPKPLPTRGDTAVVGCEKVILNRRYTRGDTAAA